VAVTYNGTTYFYATNIQGDVLAIMDADEYTVVAYTYDAWGNLLSLTGDMATTLGAINPLRYRSYVYDTETELYYVSSRYYDPEMGRWINADAFVTTGQGFMGNNMFVYCGNNPVMFSDPTGMLFEISPGGWVGRQIGELIYEWLTGEDHPNDQTDALENQIIMEQNKMIKDAVIFGWDTYMWGNNIQKETQMHETQMMLEGTARIYKYYNENEELQQGISGGRRIITGGLNICKGAVAILAPAPTPVEDLMGMYKITNGVINACYGIAEIISALWR